MGRADPRQLYLDLLKKTLTRTISVSDEYRPFQPRGREGRWLGATIGRALGSRKLVLARRVPYNPDARAEGKDRPADAETMVGLKRLDNLEQCVVDVIENDVPGDILEAGVWRGGASIFARGVLAAYGDTQRRVWLADSFQGLPPPDPDRFPADTGDLHHTVDELAIPVEEVRANFERYGLLDDRVQFLVGWFSDTLPSAPVEQLAVLRLDGDMYQSTIEALDALYPKVSRGGYVIVDDYGAVPACARAVTDYRNAHDISDPIERIDWTGVYWKRSA